MNRLLLLFAVPILQAQSINYAIGMMYDGPPQAVRCAINAKELEAMGPWQHWGEFAAFGGSVQNYVALMIRYERPVTDSEIMRCIAEIRDSKPTQEFFRLSVKSDPKGKVRHLWEIWLDGKLYAFLGWPTSGEKKWMNHLETRKTIARPERSEDARGSKQ